MKRNTILKPVIFIACLGPLASLAWKGFTGSLGANPIEVITRSTGLWTLIFLLITLSITPLRKLTGVNWVIQYRRMLGLFAFFYVSLHFTTYVWLDKFFDVHDMIKDVAKRPFITVGFSAFLTLIPLAITSTSGWIRRLGGRNWNRLHKLIYLAAALGVIHFYWLVKRDVRRPVMYGTILAVLLLYRVAANWAEKWQKQKRPARPMVRTQPAEQ